MSNEINPLLDRTPKSPEHYIDTWGDYIDQLFSLAHKGSDYDSITIAKDLLMILVNRNAKKL